LDQSLLYVAGKSHCHQVLVAVVVPG